jgi:hypothetical protein
LAKRSIRDKTKPSRLLPPQSTPSILSGSRSASSEIAFFSTKAAQEDKMTRENRGLYVAEG